MLKTLAFAIATAPAALALLSAGPTLAQVYANPTGDGAFTIESGTGQVGGYATPLPNTGAPWQSYAVTTPSGRTLGYLRGSPEAGYTFEKLPGADRHRR
jgi:hypothetical protein